MTADHCRRFLFEDAGIRGEWAFLETSLQQVLAKHDYPLVVQGLLGELMAAATLLTATLKFEGALTIQARGDGPISLVTMECTHDRKLRGIARWNGEIQQQPLAQLLGEATLAITITPIKGQRYQGIVPLEGDTLAECLEYYFQTSEQLHTQIQLFHGNNRAGGMLLQALPGSQAAAVDPATQQEQWNQISVLARTLTPDEFLNLDCETLLHRLFHQQTLSLFAPEPVAFECTCNLDRTKEALVQLGEEELKRILSERGEIDVTCQFCNHLYRFDSVDVATLFQPEANQTAPTRTQ